MKEILFDLIAPEALEFELELPGEIEMEAEPVYVITRPIPSNYGLITWNGSVLTVS